MRLFFLLSAIIHVIFFIIIWSYNIMRPRLESSHKLFIRIDVAQNYSFMDRSKFSTEKVEKIHDFNQEIPLPGIESVRTLETDNSYSEPKAAYLSSELKTTIIDTEYISSLDKVQIEDILMPLDPLSGIDIPDEDGVHIQLDSAYNDDNNKQNDNSQSNLWRLSWLDSEGRDIIFSPEIKLDNFVFNTDRLLDMVIKIQISPEGSVLNANLLPPGSGDVKLDRYIYSLTLGIVMEPVATSTGIQDGELRLMFTGRLK